MGERCRCSLLEVLDGGESSGCFHRMVAVDNTESFTIHNFFTEMYFGIHK